MNSAATHHQRLGDWNSSGTPETSSIAKDTAESRGRGNRSRHAHPPRSPDSPHCRSRPDTARKKIIFIVPRGIIHEFLFESENVCCSRCFLIFINFNWTTFHRSKMVGAECGKGLVNMKDDFACHPTCFVHLSFLSVSFLIRQSVFRSNYFLFGLWSGEKCALHFHTRFCVSTHSMVESDVPACLFVLFH